MKCWIKRNIISLNCAQTIEISRYVDKRIYMGNVYRVHTQMNVLARHSPNALHASSCKTDWLRGWCHTGSRDACRIRIYSRIIFISVCDNKYHGAHTSAGVPRLVTHRDDDDTVPRDSSHDSGFSSRPRKPKARRWWRWTS